MRQFPESTVWNHPVFQHKDYRPYTYHVAAIIEEGERLSQLAVLTQALPVLTDYLKTAETQSEVKISELSATLTAKVRIVAERLAGTYQSSLRNLLAKSVFRLQLLPAPALASAPALVIIPAPAPALVLVLPSESRLSHSGQSSPEPETTGPPKHRMSRAVKTVNDL